MLFVCTWLWGKKWDDSYVAKLFGGIKRNLSIPFRSVLLADRTNVHVPVGTVGTFILVRDPLMSKLGCLPRIRLFARDLQDAIGANKGDTIVNVDVDAVITRSIDGLFDDNEEFRIMQGFNSTNPCPFNGSLWKFQAGERHDVWDDFSWDAVQKIPRHAIPDDQGWLHHKFPDAAAYTPADGVYAFKKKTWVTGQLLPDNACFVAFPGRDPAKYADLDWVREHWRC